MPLGFWIFLGGCFIVREFQFIKKRYIEKAHLIGVQLKQSDSFIAKDSIAELERLAESAGAKVAGITVIKIDRPNPSTYIGKGKAVEIAQECIASRANIIIFDENLSPAQIRNLEEITGIKVVDRTELILDIFAQRARTNEGKLQIEMAQLKYLYPRLTGRWTHLSRQEGGIGTVGPGETQLEVDRRRVKERLSRLNIELAEVVRQRADQRKKRKRSEIPIVAIVGYTNAGKSTLMNRLTGTDLFVADKLFATLDPTTRKYILPSGKKFFISDTVGFINKLPHQLVDSFKATLEEVLEADLLLMVVDIAHEKAAEQKTAVEVVLDELGVGDTPVIYVLNKIDLVGNWGIVERFIKDYPESVPISAMTGEGLSQLIAKLDQYLPPHENIQSVAVPDTAAEIMPMIYKHSRIIDVQRDKNKTLFKVIFHGACPKELKKYVVKSR